MQENEQHETPEEAPKRRRRSEHDIWKDEMLDAMSRLGTQMESLVAEIRRLSAQDETRRRLSEAGKRSAEARAAKFGSSRPPRPEPVREGVREIPDSSPENWPSQPVMPGFAEPVREPVQGKKVRKAKTPADPPPGSLVWDDYCAAFLARHGVAPIRDARANRHCAELVKRVGPERARELARYYVGRSDAQYLKAKHPLGILTVDVQKLNTEMQTGQAMTGREAARAENAAMNDEVFRKYMDNQKNTEGVREGVQENAVSGTAG